MYRQHYPDDPGMHNEPRHRYARPSYRAANPGIWDRMKANLIAIVVGMFLISIAFGLIFWNEGRTVQTARSLEEGLELVIPLHTTEVAFEHHNGKLIHLTGQLKTDEVLKDKEYGVAVSAVKLRRKVEMYQWYEEEHTREVDDGDQTRKETSYSYYTDWRRELIRSSDFNLPTGHHNPDKFPVNAHSYESDTVHVGNFYLSKDLVAKINSWKRLTLNDPGSKDPSVNLYQGTFYHGKSPSSPEVGDVRVTFEYAGLCAGETTANDGPDEVSIIAKQQGSTLVGYETEAGDHLEMLYMGKLSPEQIFGHEMSQNAILTWALRFAGWLLMFIGFSCLTRFLTSLVDNVPIIRELVNLGVASLNLTLSISLSLTVIALGWIRYRPWFGACVLGLALIPCLVSCSRWRTRRRDYFDYRRSYYD